MPDSKFTAKEWNEVRAAFAASIMINTSLSSLAQNLDGPDWPIKGKDETPATYIDLAHDEVLELLALKGQPPERAEQLLTILRETLAFDSPFGDMVEQVTSSSGKDNQFLKNLARLGVPETFPIELVTITPETREFCQLEHLQTIGEFAVFAQSMSQNVIVGGEFREMLNALAEVDEQALKKYLPLRTGQKGLFLPEAIAALYRTRTPREKAALAKKFGVKLGSAEQIEAAKVSREELHAAEAKIAEDTAKVTAWFQAELAQLKGDLAAGQALPRLLVVLADPTVETVVNALLQPHLRVATTHGATPVGEKKRGFFARLFGRS